MLARPDEVLTDVALAAALARVRSSGWRSPTPAAPDHDELVEIARAGAGRPGRACSHAGAGSAALGGLRPAGGVARVPRRGAGTLAAARQVHFTVAVGAVLYRARCRFRSHWRATATLAGVVAVMGGIGLTLVAGAVRTLTASDRYADARGAPYDANVQQEDTGEGPLTDEVAALPAVAGLESATFVFGGFTPVGADADAFNQKTFVGLVFAGSQASFGTVVVAGREPDPQNPAEFVATKSFLERSGSQLGTQLDLWVIPSGPAHDQGFDAHGQAYRLLTATLVGVIDGPAQLQDGDPVAAFPASLLSAGDVGISATISNVTLAPGATIEDLRGQLDALPDGSAFQIDAADWVPPSVRDAVSTQGKGLSVLAAIAGVATIVVMGQLLSRQLRLTEVERLILSSMGADRRQIAADPVVGGAVPTVAGAAAALVLAWLASGIFPSGFSRHVEPHVGRRFETVALVPGAASVVVLVLAWLAVSLVVADRPRSHRRRHGVVDGVARRVPSRPATAVRFAFVRQAATEAIPGRPWSAWWPWSVCSWAPSRSGPASATWSTTPADGVTTTTSASARADSRRSPRTSSPPCRRIPT